MKRHVIILSDDRMKDSEMLEKYLGLVQEFKISWNTQVWVVRITTRTLTSVLKWLENN